MDRCSVEGCNIKNLGRRFCAKHSYRFKTYGDPNKVSIELGSRRRFVEQAKAYNGDYCLLWPFPRGGSSSKGRLQIKINGKRISVGPTICEVANGPPPTSTHQAAHSCGNGHVGCCTKKHLRWATPIENYSDRRIHETDDRGERNPNAKLTELDVLNIRSLHSAGGISYLELSQQFGVSAVQTSRICRGVQWKRQEREVADMRRRAQRLQAAE